MRRQRGFTLIEILIALTVFAILATITSTVLYQSFTARTRVTAQADKLNALQMAISFIEQDIPQIVYRNIRGNDMHEFPGFIGEKNYLEFTRDGSANPEAQEQRSTLKRIAYVCSGNKLLRRTWPVLDPEDRNRYTDKVLLEQIENCHFNYLNQTLQVLHEWRENAVNADQEKEPLPKAVQFNFRVASWGQANLLFIIPGALYGY